MSRRPSRRERLVVLAALAVACWLVLLLLVFVAFPAFIRAVLTITGN